MITEEDIKVIAALRTLLRNFKRVAAWQVAMLIEKSERTARNRLRKLEQAGMVERPYGKLSGWVVA